jgi:hypothetical protein
MVSELMNDPVLGQRYQFWFFAYNTGNPVAYSAMRLRFAPGCRSQRPGIPTNETGYLRNGMVGVLSVRASGAKDDCFVRRDACLLTQWTHIG